MVFRADWCTGLYCPVQVQGGYYAGDWRLCGAGSGLLNIVVKRSITWSVRPRESGRYGVTGFFFRTFFLTGFPGCAAFLLRGLTSFFPALAGRLSAVP